MTLENYGDTGEFVIRIVNQIVRPSLSEDGRLTTGSLTAIFAILEIICVGVTIASIPTEAEPSVIDEIIDFLGESVKRRSHEMRATMAAGLN